VNLVVDASLVVLALIDTGETRRWAMSQLAARERLTVSSAPADNLDLNSAWIF
jgi:hypothetical protein